MTKRPWKKQCICITFLYVFKLLVTVQCSSIEFLDLLTELDELKLGPCRTETMKLLPWDMYKLDTCARCYMYMSEAAFANSTRTLRYLRYGRLFDLHTRTIFEPRLENISEGITSTFKSEEFQKKWTDCCLAARLCCRQMTVAPPTVTDDPFCPRTWDGWQCWPDTPEGETAKEPCPSHVYFVSEPPPCVRYAVKRCMTNGTWYLRNNTAEWTDYRQCGVVEHMIRRMHFQIVASAISVVALIPALIIFSMYKQLQVHRITMHKNLFASLILNGIFTIIFKAIIMVQELKGSKNTATIMHQNPPWCKLLFTITMYFRMTNYMWMFCEGYYLHKLIATAFAEQKSLLMFYIIGWGFPAVPVGAYAIMRQALLDEGCWAASHGFYEWVLYVPSLMSLLLNLVFLCNIIRVLVTKLRATHANEPSQYRKAVRATLVLVPLFGLHFFLVIYRPPSSHCGWTEAFYYFSNTLDGLQGFVVALIFCYMNGEVLYLIRRSYHRHKLKNSFGAKGAVSYAMGRLSVSTQTTTVVDHHHCNHHLEPTSGTDSASD